MTQPQKKLSEQVEEDIAYLILDKLEIGEMTLERAKLIAKFCLAHIPEHVSDEKMYEILPTLDDEFVELAVVVYKHMKSYEEQYAKILASEMTDLIKHKHFEQASQKASDYFQKKVM